MTLTRLPALRALLSLLFVAACSLPSCDAKTPPATTPTAPPARTLRVLAASSLSDACRDIGTAFEVANPGATIAFSFAGSNQLRTQLENGSPGDVFISADSAQMDAAAKSSVIVPATRTIVALNTLALITPRANAANITGLADLARPGLRIVAADKAVPAGAYTRRLLDKARLTINDAAVTAIEANIVSFEESVAAVVAKVALNEADAGFAYASDAARGNGPKILLIALPDELQQQTEYSAAVTTLSANAPLAASFITFLGSPRSTQLLRQRGFTPAPTR